MQRMVRIDIDQERAHIRFDEAERLDQRRGVVPDGSRDRPTDRSRGLARRLRHLSCLGPDGDDEVDGLDRGLVHRLRRVGQFEAHLRTGGSWVVTAPRFYAHAATLAKLQGIRDALYGEDILVPAVRWIALDSTGRPWTLDSWESPMGSSNELVAVAEGWLQWCIAEEIPVTAAYDKSQGSLDDEIGGAHV